MGFGRVRVKGRSLIPSPPARIKTLQRSILLSYPISFYVQVANYFYSSACRLNNKSVVREAEKQPILALLRTKEADNIIKEQLNRMENDTKFHELFLFKLKAYTEDMIQQGVNLDTMSKLDFQLFMANKIYFWMMDEI